MNLYPHQQTFLNNIRKSIASGHTHIMCVAFCGFGKSVVIQAICKSAMERGNTVLLLAHRIEIVNQLSERMKPYSNVTVGMVQTVTRRINSMKQPDIIIIDEAHLARSASYMRILEHWTTSYALYFTATPQRTDGKGFSDIADDLITSVSAKWLIDNNYLAPFEYYAPKQLINTDELHVTRGDYDTAEAAQKLDKPHIYGDVIKAYKTYADGRKTLVYCPTVEYSRKTADVFNDAGISAAHVDGTTPKTERAEIIQKFRNGEILVLCNQGLFIEGLDVPDASCTICLRPTQSLIVHIQSTARCMRYEPGKRSVILDLVGNFERHGLPDDDREWSLEAVKKSRKHEETTVKARTCTHCFRTYSGTNRICPYCGGDNGKTKAEIKADEAAELERITAENRKQKRMEVGKARTREELERIAKERGYARGWVYQMMKIKHIS